VLKIKNWGDDLEVSTVEELRQALVERYKGKHVSICYKTAPFGMSATVFVSVSNEGHLSDTYTGGQIDFAEIEARMLPAA